MADNGFLSIEEVAESLLAETRKTVEAIIPGAGKAEQDAMVVDVLNAFGRSMFYGCPKREGNG